MKDVVGYEGLYKVTEDGQVWSIKSNRFMAQQIQKGYYHVHLSKEGKAKYVSVHRIVAMAYVENPNPEEFNIINHKDENPLNNCYTNLEWCNKKYNDNYGNRNKKNSISNRFSEKQGTEVRCIETGIVYPSISEACRATNCYSHGIVNVCEGLKENCKGLHWEYTGNKFHKQGQIRSVRCIETGKIYNTIMEAERETSIANGDISKVCRKERKTAGGFHWEYAE